jgi:hypothetical protein
MEYMYKMRVKLQIGNPHVAASRQDMKPYTEGRLASQVLIRQHGLACAWTLNASKIGLNPAMRWRHGIMHACTGFISRLRPSSF